MKIINISQLDGTQEDDWLAPFTTKSGSYFFIVCEDCSEGEAREAVAKFSSMSGLKSMRPPARVGSFRQWMAQQLEEELAVYLGNDKIAVSGDGSIPVA